MKVDNVGIVRDVGEQFLLFDINAEYFIGIIRDDFAPVNQLVAFPRFGSSDGTAWVTNEKQMIFGARTRSCAGSLLLRKGEVLPVVGENSRTFTVMMQRFGREVSLEIPKSSPSIALQTAPPPPVYVAAEPARPVVAEVAQAEAPKTHLPRPTATPPKPTPIAASRPVQVKNVNQETIKQLMPTVVIAGADAPEESPAEDVAVPVSEPPPPAAAVVAVQAASAAPELAAAPTAPVSNVVAAAAPAAAVDTQAVKVVTAAVAPTSNAAPARALPPPTVIVPEPVTSFLSLSSLTFWILLGTVVVEAVMIVTMFMKRRTVAAAIPTNEVFSFTSVGESIIDQSFKDYVGQSNGDLQGELDKFSMGHVVQFFHSSGESGTLTITTPDHQVDKLIFDRGQIIDAVCGNRCGEAAAEVILRKRQGTFRFTREDNSKRLRLIQQETMALLMEAARMIDEKGWAN